MLAILLLSGCEISIDQYLRDVREPSDEMRWEGFIYESGPLSGEAIAVTGSVTMTTLDGSWSTSLPANRRLPQLVAVR